jgi:hypothetical protein
VTPAALALAEAERRLVARVQQLGAQLDAGEDRWREYVEAVAALARLLPPERQALLTTRAMAEKLDISPRTVRKLGRAGKLEGVRLGKRGTGAIRWRA